MAVNTDRTEGSKIDVPVLIVGAGPTGLVLALWLTRLGVAVRIIDKTAEPGTTSRALAVQARTLEFYRQVGIAHAVVERGVKVAGVNLWVQGAKAARVPLRKDRRGLDPVPFALVFPQDAHERLLIERLDALGVNVERQTELVRFDQAARRRASGAQATRRLGGNLRGGLSRRLRRCVLDRARDAAHRISGRNLCGAVLRRRRGGKRPGDRLRTTRRSRRGRPSDRVSDEGQGRVRLVGTVHEVPASGDRELTFDDVSPRAIEHLKLTIAKVNWFSTYRVHHRVAHQFREGRAFLLGDAAHIHSPVGGQGMNTGIGDAVNLAWKFAAVLNGARRRRLLDTYEPERIGFARRLVATTDRGFTLVTSQGHMARFVRTRLVPVLVPLLFRLPGCAGSSSAPCRRPASSIATARLSAGTAGSVRGGDRLPWVRDGPRRGQFRPADFAGLASSCLRRAAPRGGGRLRRTRAADPRVRLAAQDGERRFCSRCALFGSAGRIRRAGRPRRRRGAIGPLFREPRVIGPR